jgi:chitinase
MGVPLYGAGWAGVPNVNNGLYQNATGPAPVPAGDVLATPGVATYSTLANLSANGYSSWFDAQRIAVSLYDPTSEIFYTYDNPETAFLKMLYVDVKVPGGLGGAYVWALKDDDTNGTMVKTMAQGLELRP